MSNPYETLRENLLDLPPFTGTAIPYWASRRERFQELAREGDPTQFMRWLDPLVDGALDASEGYAGHLWYQDMRAHPEWSRWERLLTIHPWGNPRRYSRDERTSALAISHVYALHRWEAMTGRRFLDGVDTVLEIGGGIGDFCRMIHADGFSGRYVILDLPHMRELQRCYLSLSGITADLWIEKDIPELIDSVIDRRVAIVSTWALSETPIAFRAKLFPSLLSYVSRYLLATHWSSADDDGDGGTIDNVSFFNHLQESAHVNGWATEKVAYYEEHRFLAGWRY